MNKKTESWTGDIEVGWFLGCQAPGFNQTA